MAVRLQLDKRSGYPASRPVTLFLYVRRHRGHRLRVATPIRIAPNDWSVSLERVKSKTPGAAELNPKIARLRAQTESLLTSGADDDTIRAAMKETMGIAAPVSGESLLDLFDIFLAQKKARTRASTVQTYDALRSHLSAFLGNGVGLERVGPGFLDDFAAHLTEAGLANSTANKLLTRTKGFLSHLVARGTLEKRPDFKPLPTARNAALYLTLDELHRLLSLDLSREQPGYAAARDLFIAGAVTGQRYGDLRAMKWEQVDLASGWWHLPVQKTSVTLRVPLAAPVRRIIERRKEEKTPLPVLSNQKANAYLKEVCKLAGIDAPVTVQTLRGGVQELETFPKWQVITTHSARKTFVTLSLQNGTPQSELLDFTHSDLRTLQLYAGQSEAKRREHVNRIFGGLG